MIRSQVVEKLGATVGRIGTDQYRYADPITVDAWYLGNAYSSVSAAGCRTWKG